METTLNPTYIPIDYVRFYPMNGDGTDLAGVANATVTNGVWGTAEYSYVSEQLDWGATTTFSYTSATYTNSYLVKDGVLEKNSTEVTATALNGTSGSSYGGLFLFNKTLTSQEELALTSYMNRKLGPTDQLPTNSPAVTDNLLLDIRGDGNVLDYSGNGNNGNPTNVSYSPVWGGDVMNYTGSGYASISNNFGTGSHIIEAEIEVGLLNSTNQWIFSKSNDSSAPAGEGWGLGFRINTSNQIQALCVTTNPSIATYTVNSTDTLTVGNKYKIGVVFNNVAKTLELFVDNVSKGSVSTGDTLRINTANVESLIGAFRELGGGYIAGFTGDIGLVRVYSDVLTTDERTANYQKNLSYIHGPKHSLPNLIDGQVLRINRPQVAGVYYDQTGNGNNGTATNVTDTALGLNNLMGFNGNGMVRFSSSIIPQGAKTIAFRINSTDTTNTQFIIGNQRVTTLDNGTVLVYDATNGIRMLLINAGAVLLNINPVLPTIFDGDKHLCVYTWDGTTSANGGKVYVDNVLIAQATATTTVEGTPSYNLSIGRDPDNNPPDDYLTGDLSTPLIIPRELSRDEVSQLRYSNFIPN